MSPPLGPHKRCMAFVGVVGAGRNSGHQEGCFLWYNGNWNNIYRPQRGGNGNIPFISHFMVIYIYIIWLIIIYVYIGISKQVHELWDEMGRIMATIVDKMMIHIDKPSACQMPHFFVPSNPRWWYGKPKLPLRMVYPAFPTRFGVELPHDAWNCEASCELPNALIIYTYLYSIQYLHVFTKCSKPKKMLSCGFTWMTGWLTGKPAAVQPAEVDPKKRSRKWAIIGKLGNAMIVKTSLW